MFVLLFAIINARIVSEIKVDKDLQTPLETPLAIVGAKYVSNYQKSIAYVDKYVLNTLYYNLTDGFTGEPMFSLSNPTEGQLYAGPLILATPDQKQAPVANYFKSNPASRTAYICLGSIQKNCVASMENNRRHWRKVKMEITARNSADNGKWVTIKLEERFLFWGNIHVYLETGNRFWQRTLIAKLKPIVVKEEPYLLHRPGRDNHYLVVMKPGVDAAFMALVAARFAKLQH